PFFLAVCFKIFGMENYAAAVWVQIALELAGCLLLADFVWQIAPPALSQRAGHCTLWLAVLCPFTAMYAANPLTEALTLFLIALALWAAARFQRRAGWALALCFTFAITYAALLRPDGALVGVALGPAMVIGLMQRDKRVAMPTRRAARMALVCLLLALTPFAVWTVRNWRVFHVFEPLVPRYATDPGEDIHAGWESWIKTWCLDFASTYNTYWNVPGSTLDISQLPRRAFDSPAQYAETAELAADYDNNGQSLTPDID